MNIGKNLRKIATGMALLCSLTSGNETGHSEKISGNLIYKTASEEYMTKIADARLKDIELEDTLDAIVEEKNPEKFANAMRESPMQLMEAINRNVEKRYSENPRFYDSLERLLQSEKQQIDYAKKAFADRKIPAKYVSLGIVESRLKHNAVSSKNAVGAYQFTAATIQKHDRYSITESQDVRLSPIISAEFAAMELEKLFNKFGDWNLALARYNSSMPEKYLKEISANGKERRPTLEGYIKYLGNKIGGEQKFFRYAWENLEYIAKNNFTAKTLEESYPEVLENSIGAAFKIYTMENPSKDVVVVIGKKENLRTAVRRSLKRAYGFTTTNGTNWAMNFIGGKIEDINKVYPNQKITIPGIKNLDEFEERFGQNLKKYNRHIRNSSEPFGENVRIVAGS